MPHEHTIYLADSANAPYGKKSPETIKELSIKNTELLLNKGAKIIVVACNTATTNAIDHLRANYTVPFIGIEPAIKPAALKTQTNSVGILATQGTLSSSLFAQTSEAFARDVNVIEIVGSGLVELIEKGDLDAPELKELLQDYLSPMIDADIDHLVLGCSHYPYLLPLLKELLPEHVNIIDSGAAVARQTQKVLSENDLEFSSEPAEHLFYTNGDPKVLKKILSSYPAITQVSYLDF